MARRHGWQLPFHTFQVVAITVFFLLAVAFYAFFAPFLGTDVLEYVAIGVYTLVALLVFILYARCTAIDPADPAILISPDERLAGKNASKGEPRIVEPNHSQDVLRESTGSKTGGFFCGFLVKEDCWKGEDVNQQKTNEEDALFCTLCNAEVRKFSKHCRSCDKCVDVFDHHCQWLNNCVGRKNYVSFLALMAASLVWLVVQSGVGVAVFVRCFVNKKEMENQIIDKLGNGFSRYPFAIVVAICTFVSLVACIPLGELFFFHMILIRKGITTYEYVVAMRAQSEPPGPSMDGDQQSVPSSPTGSAATGLSGGSSLGLPYKSAWCTPPRVFVDQDEIIPHLGPGRVPSTMDPDATGFPDKGKRLPKREIKISAWKLAKLDSNEAIKAAARARASSSVLRPIGSRQHPDSGYCSSDNASGASSVSTDLGLHKDGKRSVRLSLKNSYPPSRASRDDIEAGTRSVSSFSSPAHTNNSVALSPLPLDLHGSSPDVRRATVTVGKLMSNMEHFNPIYQTSANESPCSTRTNEAHESIATHRLNEQPVRKNKGNARENARPSVVWDSAVGRYVSVLPSAGDSNPVGSTYRTGRPDASLAAAILSPLQAKHGHQKFSGIEDQAKPSLGSLRGNVVYTEQSIFFGGPLLMGDTAGSSKLRSSETLAGEGASVSQVQETRAERGRSDQFPVFIPKGSEAPNSS